MTAYQSRMGYAQADGPVRTPRSIEYDLLARCTQALSIAWIKRKSDFPALAKALRENLQLWAALAADVAEPDNGLPKDLRAKLFYLYEFTSEHSRAVLEGRATVEVLVDINTAVMKGLRGGGAA